VTYGGDSGNRIFVLYWRCSLIRVSVIIGSTVFQMDHYRVLPNVYLRAIRDFNFAIEIA
jgi:hypothetical protein